MRNTFYVMFISAFVTFLKNLSIIFFLAACLAFCSFLSLFFSVYMTSTGVKIFVDLVFGSHEKETILTDQNNTDSFIFCLANKYINGSYSIGSENVNA